MFERLDDSNFILYCAKHYDNPQCHDTDEFYEDLRRIKYIKKLITRYVVTGDLKERLILNHIIILNNVFGPIHLSRILFLKMEKQLKYIKPFLIMLNILPEKVYNIGKEGKFFVTDEIEMDLTIIEALRKI
jgi:hypothetical protein